MKLKLAILAALLSLVTGCVSWTYNVAPYQVTAENAESLKSYNLKPMSVGTFRAREGLNVKRKSGSKKKPGSASIRCPLVPPLGLEAWHTAVSPSFEGYIEKALIEELKLAGLYDAASPLVITGELVQIYAGNPYDRRWDITLTLTNARNENMTTTVSDFREFHVGWFNANRGWTNPVCKDFSRQFASAVKRLISDVIDDPKFREFAN